jgi:myosin heavy subunit
MNSPHYFCVGFLSLFLLSCGPKDDPELVKKLQEVEEEIALKESEMEAMTKEIKMIKGDDHSEDLANLKAELQSIEEQQEALQKEVALMEETGKKDQVAFDEYQKKYRVRSK